MGNTGPESTVPPAASVVGAAGLRPAMANDGQGREVKFEDAHKELEQIVARLEQGQAPLDEMTELWRRGEELYAFCRAQLDAAQGRIEELAKGPAKDDEVSASM